MTKQDFIKKVYGKYWSEWKADINDNGLLETTLPLPNIMMKELNLKKHTICTYTPMLLLGIEENNGWTKILSVDDLPDFKDELLIFRNKEGFTTTWQSDDIKSTPNYFLRYSHWILKDKILEPLF